MLSSLEESFHHRPSDDGCFEYRPHGSRNRRLLPNELPRITLLNRARRNCTCPPAAAAACQFCTIAHDDRYL